MRFGWFVVGAQTHKAFLRHFDLHLLDFAELAIGDELFELTHHGVAGVVVGGAEESFGFGDDFCDGFAFGHAGGERFFTNHRETGVQRVNHDILVVIGRRKYYDGIEFVLFGF